MDGIYTIRFTTEFISVFQESSPLVLSPPVSDYSITVNEVTITTVNDTSANITVAIGNGQYTVMVAANNDVGSSSGNPSVDIGNVSSSYLCISLYDVLYSAVKV